YQQNGKAEAAISRFREYLRAAQDIPPDERARVERFIKELESELQAAAPPTVETPPSAPRDPAPRAEPQPVPDVNRPALPPPRRSSGLRTAAIALGLLSVAGVTTG